MLKVTSSLERASNLRRVTEREAAATNLALSDDISARILFDQPHENPGILTPQRASIDFKTLRPTTTY